MPAEQSVFIGCTDSSSPYFRGVPDLDDDLLIWYTKIREIIDDLGNKSPGLVDKLSELRDDIYSYVGEFELDRHS